MIHARRSLQRPWIFTNISIHYEMHGAIDIFCLLLVNDSLVNFSGEFLWHSYTSSCSAVVVCNELNEQKRRHRLIEYRFHCT